MFGKGKTPSLANELLPGNSSTDDGGPVRTVEPADILDNSAIDPDSGVKRGLKNRHLSMMALAGIIGPGLLVGAGGALSSGGPASLLIGFGVIGMFIPTLKGFITNYRWIKKKGGTFA